MPLIKEHRLALAESEVERRRDALVDTVGRFADMLEPKKIMGEIWDNAKDKGADLAENAVDAVRKRPLLFGGIAAALTAFIAREPLKDAAVTAYGAMTSKKKNSGQMKKGAAERPGGQAPPKPPAKRRPRAAAKAAAKTVEKKA